MEPAYFHTVKSLLLDLGYAITHEDEEQELFWIRDEDSGIANLIVDCEDPLLVLEQVIMPVPGDSADLFRRLLQMNRLLVHGAFVLDDTAQAILFRDTLRIENLDRNELEGSIEALSLALAENAEELLAFNKK